MPEEGRARTNAGATAAGPVGSSTGPVGSSTGPVGSSTDAGEWASNTADRLDELIGKVRSQTTDRLVSVARLVVFGLLAVVMGGMAAVLLVAAAVRALDELIPQEVWLAYLILGAIFTGIGLFLWSKKERPPSTA
jgi:hypothetical protein